MRRLSEPGALKGARKYELWWLYGLILSFAHERPILILTAMDRVNPRLFDVMVVIGLLFVLPRRYKSVRLPREYYLWASIVAVYVFCALVYSVLLLPRLYAEFSLFFAGQYVENLLAIYMALKIPLTQGRKEKVMWTIAVGGVYVAVYSIYQYFRTTAGGEVEIAPGKFVHYFNHIITGPLGYSYFHIAQFSSLCAIVTLSLIELARSSARKWGVFLLALFIGWPLLFSGSRTGLGLLVISVAIGVLLLRGAKLRFLALVLALGVVMTVLDNPVDQQMLRQSTTFSRLSGSEGTHNSIENRLSFMFRVDFNNYKWGYLIPFIGGGFYVVPQHVGSSDDYRIGYGIHNTYLFPFEQGGILAAIMFVVFLTSIIRKLNGVRKKGSGSDRALAIGALSYMLASLPVYLGGQIFWVGFDSGHFNAFLVMLLLLALRPSRVASQQKLIVTSTIGSKLSLHMERRATGAGAN